MFEEMVDLLFNILLFSTLLSKFISTDYQTYDTHYYVERT